MACYSYQSWRHINAQHGTIIHLPRFKDGPVQLRGAGAQGGCWRAGDAKHAGWK